MTHFSQAVGVLVWLRDPSPPSQTPPAILAMARWCAKHQYALIYGAPHQLSVEKDRLFLDGWQICPNTGAWSKAQHCPVSALYNRFPRSRSPEEIDHAEALALSLHVPFGNAWAFQQLAQDKWRTYLAWKEAGLPTPETLLAPQLPPISQMKRWSTSFLKPRYGAFGKGISRIERRKRGWRIQGEDPQDLPHDESFVEWWKERTSKATLLLQRGIPSYLTQVAGASIRTLLQHRRTSEGTTPPRKVWQAAPRVLRTSPHDPIANAARGALVTPLVDAWTESFGPQGCQALLGCLEHLEQRAASALLNELPPYPRGLVLEMGLDILLDPKGELWLLEVNGFPQGRLEKIAERDPPRFLAAMEQVQWHPLAYLLQQVHGTTQDFP